jgi:HD-GYP domain-containing protein (c-di-GMP phosphodiesterase class II)
VTHDAAPADEQVRAAEVVAALSLATDLGIGVPLEHGLQSALFATRLCDCLDVDPHAASDAYYACLLFYVGCTAGAEEAAELFGGEGGLTTHAGPSRFGSRAESMRGIVRALAPPGSAPAPVRAVRAARKLPKAAREYRRLVPQFCEVGEMLSDRLGLASSVRALFVHFTERWDGKGDFSTAKREEIPLAVRIAHVARDAAFQRMLGGDEFAARVIRERAGGAFDPAIAKRLSDDASEILALEPGASVWEDVLACEPGPHVTLQGEEIDRALAAMGNFADLASHYLIGHSAGVAALATAAGRHCRLDDAQLMNVRRSAFVHDVGRVAVPILVWHKAGPLSPDEWEHVRLHAYHTERVLSRSSFLMALAPVATAHHERLDGSGYHRGVGAGTLPPPARVLAAADAYHAMTEPRPHREALPPDRAAEELGREARAARLDPDAVAAVLEAAGQPAPRLERPAGLTERELEVVGLVARGLQTKQIAGVLGISVKTADRHIQNAYGKMGVSTRAAAALFAMQHGLTAWGELPMAHAAERA